jgi:hypothetical protein
MHVKRVNLSFQYLDGIQLNNYGMLTYKPQHSGIILKNNAKISNLNPGIIEVTSGNEKRQNDGKPPNIIIIY